jgi:hypothetical protein
MRVGEDRPAGRITPLPRENAGVEDIPTRLARGLWTLYEPVHAVAYFAPQAADAFEAAGLRGFWRGYFAGRSAPLGPVGPAPVIALFGSFSPSMVERALPAVWGLITPEAALRARALGAAAAIRACVGAVDVSATVESLEQVVHDLPVAGRALAAANAALPTQGDSFERLWQAVTTLREWRGDAHIAALVTHGLAGLDILVLRCLLDIGRARMQPARGWNDAEWALATDRLMKRGLLDDAGVTAAGRDRIAMTERATDDASVVGTAQEMRELGRLLRPIAIACASRLLFPNPIGLVGAWDPDEDPDAQRVTRP